MQMNKCPSCGAPKTNYDRCEYCGTVFKTSPEYVAPECFSSNAVPYIVQRASNNADDIAELKRRIVELQYLTAEAQRRSAWCMRGLLVLICALAGAILTLIWR